MADKIDKSFYGEFSPLKEGFADGEQFNKIPPPFPTDPYEKLRIVCGPRDKDNQIYKLEDLEHYIEPTWYLRINQYLDVPILKFLGEEKLDLKSPRWWDRLVKVKGFMEFLNRFTFDMSNIRNNYFDILIGDLGSIEFAQWVVYNSWKLKEDFNTYFAARHGHIELLQWLVTNGCKINETVAHNALKNGRLNVLKWIDAHHKYITFDERSLRIAVCLNYLPIVKWLVERGNTITNTHIAIATKRHFHKLLSYLKGEDVYKNIPEKYDTKNMNKFTFNEWFTSDDSS